MKIKIPDRYSATLQLNRYQSRLFQFTTLANTSIVYLMVRTKGVEPLNI